MEKLVGLDVFVRSASQPAPIAGQVAGFELVSIANRGTQVWPGPTLKIQLTDIHRCRFMYRGGGTPTCLELLTELEKRGFVWVELAKLSEYNGVAGYT